jgi:hypothetical protein
MSSVEPGEVLAPRAETFSLIRSLDAKQEGFQIDVGVWGQRVAIGFEEHQGSDGAKVINPLECRFSVVGIKVDGFGLNSLLNAANVSLFDEFFATRGLGEKKR